MSGPLTSNICRCPRFYVSCSNHLSAYEVFCWLGHKQLYAIWIGDRTNYGCLFILWKICNFNSDQRSQFTSVLYINLLKEHKMQINMDKKGRAPLTIFSLNAWGAAWNMCISIWLHTRMEMNYIAVSIIILSSIIFYRLHQSLINKTLASCYMLNASWFVRQHCGGLVIYQHILNRPTHKAKLWLAYDALVQ